MRAFAEALDAVPMALAENSGLSPIETLANIKSRQAKEKNTRLGVDCMQTGSNGKFKFRMVDLARFIFLPISMLRGLQLQCVLAFSLHRRCSCLLRGTSLVTRTYAVPWCHTWSASTGCSAIPPRNSNTLHIQRCNYAWR